MRAILALCALAAACVASEPQQSAQATPPPEVIEAQEEAQAAPEPQPPPPILDPTIAPPMAQGTTGSVVAPTLLPLNAPPPPSTLSLNCAGAFAQGGVALCRTLPGARIVVDGTDRGAASSEGWAVIGFDRDAPREAIVEARAGGETARQTFAILPREFSIQRVDGLPPQTVSPTDPAVVARIARERTIKNRGFSSRADAQGWLDSFIWPVEGRISGSWGNQRVLNGEPRSPHYGVDIAMPAGTAIRAPAGGVVSLAEPDLYLEGGLVLIDHGQGLISMYLHMSRLDVREGDRVTQGQVIGAVGARGRATGPHLCWRMRWRDRQVDPSLAILALAEARRTLASGPAQ
ncbi:MAG: M23 family metallopeptidase [Hyphomonadaceae bacterium]